MGKSRKDFTVCIKLSGKKNDTAKAVVKLASIKKKKSRKNEKTGGSQRPRRVILVSACPSADSFAHWGWGKAHVQQESAGH